MINFSQLVDHVLPRLVTFGSGGVAAPSRKAYRHPRMCTTRRWIRHPFVPGSLSCSNANPAEGCGDFTHLPVVIVVRLTMSMVRSSNG
jgi:hypothetical protein